jgi:hypothetical protein
LARLEKNGFEFQPDAVMFNVIDDYEWVLNETTHTIADKGLRVPYDFVARAVEQAGVTPGLNRSVAEQRLARFAPGLVRSYYQRLFDESIAHGAKPIVVFIPIPEDQSDVQAGIAEQAETARSIGLPVIDITSAYDTLAHRSEIWARGYDHHPNARGQAMLADALYKQLLPMLEHAQPR